jgi:hypothetical protein
LPQSLPQDDAAFAAQQPAAALTLAAGLPPAVPDSPVPDSPVTTPAVSAHPAPAALVTARTSAPSGAAPAPANRLGPGSQLQRPGRHRRTLVFGGPLFGGGPRSPRR